MLTPRCTRLVVTKESVVSRRPRVLIFIVTDFGRRDGPVLWAANLLECMARIPDMDFVVVTSGPENAAAANQAFIEGLGLEHFFVPFRQVLEPGSSTRFKRLAIAFDRLTTILSDKYYFLLERDARKQKHVDAAVMRIVTEKRPDLIVINSRNGALHAPSAFFSGTPCCFIALDNEIAYHRLYRSQVGPIGEKTMHQLSRWVYRHGNWIANMRFRRYIKGVYKHCSGVVALTQNDLPPYLPDHVVTAEIPPILPKSDAQWSYRGTRHVLFVGNINVLKLPHVANRLAIEWICSRLSPALLRIDPTIVVNIIGASTNEAPGTWKQANITFMGRSNKAELIRQMTTADLFIAPIANGQGAKLKLAECVSHGTPFLASQGAMSGLPFLKSIPRIDLEQPDAAARLVVEHLNSPEALIKLSQSIAEQTHRARAEQDLAWSTFLRSSLRTIRQGGCSQKHAIESDAAVDDRSAT